MQRKINYKKKLESFLKRNNEHSLAEFEDPIIWNELGKDEKKLLADLFIARGEREILDGDNNVYRSFEMACKLNPNDSQLYFKQAKAYLQQGQNARCLTLACSALSTSVSLSSANIEAWHLWAWTLAQLGMHHSDQAYFEDSDKKYQKAEQLAKLQQTQIPEIYSDWGLSWCCQGKLSGEAGDFRRAIELYRQAEALGLENAHFLNAFGDAIWEFAALTGQNHLFNESITYYKKSIDAYPSNHEAWLNLACISQKLYEISPTKGYYSLAHESFQKVVNLTPADSYAWFKWGVLQAMAGKLKLDEQLIEESLKKFERADELEPGQAEVLGCWSDALLISGICTENVARMRAAKDMIMRALELQPDNADFWCQYGNCFNELGLYFEDESYFHHAIEKYHYGLSLNKEHSPLWHGLSLSHYSVGEAKNEIAWVEKSIQFCKKAIEAGGQSSPQIWNDWGVALMKLGEMTGQPEHIGEAVEKFEKAVGQYLEEADDMPVDPELYYNLGCALDFMGDFTEIADFYERAIKALEKALAIFPGYSHARYNLALAYFHLGELMSDLDCYSKSIHLFQNLLANDPEDEMGWNEWGNVLVHFAMLISDPASNDTIDSLYREAEEKFLQAIGLGCTPAYYNLACLYSLMGNFNEAMFYMEKAGDNNALPPIDEIMQDEWLDGLRKTSGFHYYISHLTLNKKTSEDYFNK